MQLGVRRWPIGLRIAGWRCQQQGGVRGDQKMSETLRIFPVIDLDVYVAPYTYFKKLKPRYIKGASPSADTTTLSLDQNGWLYP